MGANMSLYLTVRRELSMLSNSNFQMQNMKKKHSTNLWLKALVWNLAWCYNPLNFRSKLNQIRDSSQSLYEVVMKEELHGWCRSFFGLEAVVRMLIIMQLSLLMRQL